MSMGIAALVADLKTSLGDAGAVFKGADDADFKRFLALALPDMQTKRPRTLVGVVTLVVDQARYAVTDADFAGFKTHFWGDGARRFKPWDMNWPGALPRVNAEWDGAAWWLSLSPAPTAVQLASLGDQFRFMFFGRHVLADDGAETTVQAEARGLLLLRAQAEAMRELAMRNITKPVQLRDGLSGTPRNSTPAAMHAQLLQMFKEAR